MESFNGGDDIAWLKPDENGELRAINPEAGFLEWLPALLRKQTQMQWIQ